MYETLEVQKNEQDFHIISNKILIYGLSTDIPSKCRLLALRLAQWFLVTYVVNDISATSCTTTHPLSLMLVREEAATNPSYFLPTLQWGHSYLYTRKEEEGPSPLIKGEKEQTGDACGIGICFKKQQPCEECRSIRTRWQPAPSGILGDSFSAFSRQAGLDTDCHSMFPTFSHIDHMGCSHHTVSSSTVPGKDYCWWVENPIKMTSISRVNHASQTAEPHFPCCH